MNEIKIFESTEFGKVRVLEINGGPYFVGKDVAELLGYVDCFGALKKHVDDDDKLICQIDSAGQKRDVTVINESGVYALIFGSKLPNAKAFKKWVTSEVLPSIRKTGGYSKPLSINEMILEMAKANVEQERKLIAISTKQEEQAKQIEIINKRIDMFNGIDGTNSREELHHKLNAYCYKNGIPQSKGWNVLKQMYNDSYNTNISLLITNYQKVTGMKKRPTMPEYLEATGQLADAHAVLDKLLN